MDGGERGEMLEAIRLAVYRSLAGTGRLPSADQLVEIAGSTVRAAEATVELARQRAWVFAIPHLVPACGPAIVVGA